MSVKQDIEQSVGYWLCSTSHLYQRVFNERLAPHGLTFRQAQVFGWLILLDELPQHELAQRMMIEPATLVGVLDRMSRDGWITRVPCCEDRRRKLIRLTEKAEEAEKVIFDVGAELREQATAGFNDEERQRLCEMLARIRENLGRACGVATECIDADCLDADRIVASRN